MKPFLRWAGSKRQLLSELRPYWSNNSGRYIEPFAGSACLFFDIEPAYAFLGDINQELIHAYRVIKNDPVIVIEALKRMGVSKKTYYKVRDLPFTTLNDAERAAAFLYLNRYCFNGLYRTNSQGKFNVPYGDHQGNTKFDFNVILESSQQLATTQLFCCDFEYLVFLAQPGDFVYMDPPYWVEKSRAFSQYHANSFSAKDLKRLSSCLAHLDRIGAKFLVSYADSKEGYRALGDWAVRRVLTKRNIAGFISSRKTSTEILATNILVPEVLNDCI